MIVFICKVSYLFDRTVKKIVFAVTESRISQTVLSFLMFVKSHISLCVILFFRQFIKFCLIIMYIISFWTAFTRSLGKLFFAFCREKHKSAFITYHYYVFDRLHYGSPLISYLIGLSNKLVTVANLVDQKRLLASCSV